jgi:hypothetical protein
MTGMTMVVHPAADLFPMITDEEFDALVDSIRDHGLMHPVTFTPDGVLLDGRNRIRACAAAGVEPRSETYDGDDPTGYVIRVNVQRRHLTIGQRSLVALEALPLFSAEASKRKGTRTDLRADLPTGSSGRARDNAAKMVGVSGRAVQMAKRLVDKAPDLAGDVRSGVLTLDAADQQLRRRVSYQREMKTRQPAFDASVSDAQGQHWKMQHGDFRDRLESLESASVDAIVTDPPYSADALPLHGATLPSTPPAC